MQLKYFSFIIAFLLLIHNLNAQVSDNNLLSNSDLIPFQDKNGLFGYKSKKNGEIKIKADWDYAFEFDTTGKATVCKGCRDLGFGLWDFDQNVKMYEIDKNGITGEPHTTQTVYLNNYMTVYRDDNLYGIYTGGELVPPEYHKIVPAYPFNGNLLVKKDNKWGMINSKGDFVLPIEYSYISTNDGSYFKIQKGEYRYPVDTNQKITYGLVNKNGKILIPLGNKSFSNVSDGVIILYETVGNSEKLGLIDTLQKIIIPPKYDNSWSFNKGLLPVCINCRERYIGDNPWIVGGQWGIIDKTGKEIISPVTGKDQIDQMYWFSENMLSFCQGCKFDTVHKKWTGGKYGFIDSLGKISIPAVYDSASGFFYGKAKVITKNKSGKKIGFIDKTGKIIIPLSDKYDDIGMFYDDIALVKKGGKYGYVNTAMKELVPVKYDWAYDFYEEYSILKLSKKYGVINRKGETVIPFEYDDISNYGNKSIFSVSKNGKNYKINSKKEVIPEN